jgi:group I intron endonuclease
MIGIYKITNPAGRVYIGKSIDIENRFKQHKINTTNKLLKELFINYGIDNHSFEVVEECSIDLLIEKERYYIRIFDKQGIALNESTVNHIQYKRNVPVEYVEILDKYLDELKAERKRNIHPDFVDKMDKHLNKLKESETKKESKK